MDYILAIDETGEFNILRNGDSSFVCGVLMPRDDDKIRDRFKEAFVKCGEGVTAPDDIPSLLKDGDRERFHYCELRDTNKRMILRDVFLSNNDDGVISNIFVSDGKPLLYANNQNWWLIAIVCVIKKAMEAINESDTIEVRIDPRNRKVLGIVSSKDSINITENREQTRITIPADKIDQITLDKIEGSKCSVQFDDNNIKVNMDRMPQQCSVSISLQHSVVQKRSQQFFNYHNIIKDQLYSIFNDNNASFIFNGNDPYVAIADIVSGIVNKDSSINKINCPCVDFMVDVDNIESLADENPSVAMSVIFQEVLNNKYDNCNLMNRILEMEMDDTEIVKIWDDFQTMLNYKMDVRDLNSNFEKKVVTIFLETFKNRYLTRANKIPRGINTMEILTLFLKYYSHIGSDTMPFERDAILNEIRNTKTDGRATMRWVKYISYLSSYTQFCYNSYDFLTPLDELNDAIERQKKIRELTKDYTGNSDNHLSILYGSVAQLCAYYGRYEKALAYFDKSLEFAANNQNQTYSYLATIAVLQKDKKSAVENFKKCTGQSPLEYYKDGDYKNPKNASWNLLLYCKLRALDFCSEKSTLDIEGINIDTDYRGSKEYPFTLVQKWEGIAQMNDPKFADKEKAAHYFKDAIAMQWNDSEFTIKTLALPIIQCLARIEPDNEYCRNYAQYMQELTKQSGNFARYMDKHAKFKEINTEASLWDCATFLPFIYS